MAKSECDAECKNSSGVGLLECFGKVNTEVQQKSCVVNHHRKTKKRAPDKPVAYADALVPPWSSSEETGAAAAADLVDEAAAAVVVGSRPDHRWTTAASETAAAVVAVDRTSAGFAAAVAVAAPSDNMGKN